jgi:hypothetical protein
VKILRIAGENLASLAAAFDELLELARSAP